MPTCLSGLCGMLAANIDHSSQLRHWLREYRLPRQVKICVDLFGKLHVHVDFRPFQADLVFATRRDAIALPLPRYALALP